MDEFVVMPNHIHGVIFIKNTGALPGDAPSLGKIIGVFKSITNNEYIHGEPLAEIQLALPCGVKNKLKMLIYYM